jgi:hypothetical protein
MTSSQKKQHWQRHIRAWQASGQTQAAYCHAHHLSLASFGYWRKRCAAVPDSVSLPAVIPVVRENAVSGVQLRSPGGWQILLPAGLDTTALGQLLSSLP